MMFGSLAEGEKAITVIALPPGRFRNFYMICDNDLQELLPAELRLAVFTLDRGWDAWPVLLDGGEGPYTKVLDHPEFVCGLSIRREDAGDVRVSWAVI